MTSEIKLENYTTEAIIKALKTVEKMSAYQKQYLEDNREQRLAYMKAYRKAHPNMNRERYNLENRTQTSKRSKG